MSLFAFLYAVISGSQLGGSELQGNAYWDAALNFTLQNLHSMERFMGWVALASLVILVILFAISKSKEGVVFGGCFIYTLVLSVTLWVVGLFHILVVGYLANHFRPEIGATGPGFWAVLIFMILFSWS